MSNRVLKVQAAAHLLGTTVDTVRRMVDVFGIDVARQDAGARTRLFSFENIFELARHRAGRLKMAGGARRPPVVATVYAGKYGVGKTTLASNFGLHFALSGLRTLIIDLDPQAGLSRSFGFDSDTTAEEAIEYGIPLSIIVEYHFGDLVHDCSANRLSLQEVVKKPFGDSGPHILPADLSLDGLESMLNRGALDHGHSALSLAEFIRMGMSKTDSFDISEYDVIVLVAPPAANQVTQGAMLASDVVVSPVAMATSSSKALSHLSRIVEELPYQIGRKPELILVANFFDPSRIRAIGELTVLKQMYKSAWLDRSIQSSEDLSSSRRGQTDLPIILAKPRCQAAIELRESAAALLSRLGLSAATPKSRAAI